MKNWINRMLSGADKAPGVEGEVADDAPEAAGATDGYGAQVDAAYYRWLTASSGYQAGLEVEDHILELVRTLALDPAAASGLVPRVPELIPQLLRDLADDDVSTGDLARSVERDLVLVAEVIREANSAYYRPLQPVKSLDAAMMMIGQNGLRMLLARIAFRPLIKMADQGFARQAAPLVWNQSEKCALASSLMAPGLGAGVFEAYLAGLMQNLGLVVAFRLAERAVGSADASGKIPGSSEFGARLFAVSRELSATIAEHWEFPAVVVEGIAGAGLPDASPLARTLERGDRIAKLRILVDAHVVAQDDVLVTDGLDSFERRCLGKLGDLPG
jgi:HD-like signal output (HDOD) protein